MNVLEVEVRRIRVATKDWSLLAKRTPFASGLVLAPDNFVYNKKANFLHQFNVVGSDWECEQTMFRVLVYVRSDYANSPSVSHDSVHFPECLAHTRQKFVIPVQAPEVE